MAHYQYDKGAIDRAKARIDYCQKLIDNARLVKLGDKDAVKNALETIREMEFTAKANVFSLLKKGIEQGDSLARYNLGLMEAYQDVITLFEAPDSFIKQLEDDMVQDKDLLKQAELYAKVSGGE